MKHLKVETDFLFEIFIEFLFHLAGTAFVKEKKSHTDKNILYFLTLKLCNFNVHMK